MSVADLVTRMNYASRNTYYSHLKRADLSPGLLKRYGRILNYDFSADIPELEGLQIEEPAPAFLKAPFNLEDATSQRDYYYRLFIDLLERVRVLEEENAKLKKADAPRLPGRKG